MRTILLYRWLDGTINYKVLYIMYILVSVLIILGRPLSQIISGRVHRGHKLGAGHADTRVHSSALRLLSAGEHGVTEAPRDSTPALSWPVRVKTSLLVVFAAVESQRSAEPFERAATYILRGIHSLTLTKPVCTIRAKSSRRQPGD